MNRQTGGVLVRWIILLLAGVLSEGVLLVEFLFLSGMGERSSASFAVFGSPFTAIGLMRLAPFVWVVLALLVAARRHIAARTWLRLHLIGIPVAIYRYTTHIASDGTSVAVYPPGRFVLWIPYVLIVVFWWWAVERFAKQVSARNRL